MSLKTGCYIAAFYSAVSFNLLLMAQFKSWLLSKIYYVSSLLIIAQHFSKNAELSNAFMDGNLS